MGEDKQPGHALLFLGGVSKYLIQALLSFIYNGKVEVEAEHMEQFTKMLKDFKVLDQHLKSHVEAKIDPDVLEPIDQLKVEYDSHDSNNSQNDFDEDGDGFEEDLNTAEPKKKSLRQRCWQSPQSNTAKSSWRRKSRAFRLSPATNVSSGRKVLSGCNLTFAGFMGRSGPASIVERCWGLRAG